MKPKLNDKKKFKNNIQQLSVKNVEIDIFSNDTPRVDVKIGQEFQATLPKLRSKLSCYRIHDKSCLYWAPTENISEFKLNEFLLKSKEDANFTIDQALGMLFWRKYNFNKAFIDIQNYEIQTDWAEEDSKRFEKAFKIYKKNFAGIHLMMPDKKISALVNYYYLRKTKILQKNNSENICSIMNKNKN